jgi:hypothetical protein
VYEPDVSAVTWSALGFHFQHAHPVLTVNAESQTGVVSFMKMKNTAEENSRRQQNGPFEPSMLSENIASKGAICRGLVAEGV